MKRKTVLSIFACIMIMIITATSAFADGSFALETNPNSEGTIAVNANENVVLTIPATAVPTELEFEYSSKQTGFIDGSALKGKLAITDSHKSGDNYVIELSLENIIAAIKADSRNEVDTDSLVNTAGDSIDVVVKYNTDKTIAVHIYSPENDIQALLDSVDKADKQPADEKGKLTNVTEEMEYRVKGNTGAWTSVTAEEESAGFVEVVPETYEIRIKSTVEDETAYLSTLGNIKEVTVGEVESYNIYVAGTELTSANNPMTLSGGNNSGTASYDKTTNTLTLTNVTIHTSNKIIGEFVPGIAITGTGDPITINIVGSATIAPEVVTGATFYAGIQCTNRALTITGGDLAITLPDDSTADACFGIMGLSSAAQDAQGYAAGASSLPNSVANVTIDNKTTVVVQNAKTDAVGVAGGTLNVKKTLVVDIRDSQANAYGLRVRTVSVDQPAKLNVQIDKAKTTAYGIVCESNGSILSKGDVDVSVGNRTSGSTGDLIGIAATVLESQGGTITAVTSWSTDAYGKSTAFLTDKTNGKIIAGNACKQIELCAIAYAVNAENATDIKNIVTVGNNHKVQGDLDDITDTLSTVNLKSLMYLKIYDKNLVPVTSVSVSGESEIAVGGSSQYSASVLPDDATDRTVTWTVSDDSLATVTDEGLVTLKSAAAVGNTFKVIATSDADSTKKDEKTITVKSPDIAVESISLDKTSGAMVVGDDITLTATVTPSTATNQNINWTTDPASSAAVTVTPSNDGKQCKITAKAVSTSAVKVIATSAADSSKKAEFTITGITEPTITLTKVSTDPVFTSLSGTKTLEVAVSPSTDYTKSKITWSIVSGGDVCLISKTGDNTKAAVSPVKVGTATVRATVYAGTTYAKYVDFTVTVKSTDYAITYPSVNNSLIWYYDASSKPGFFVKTNIPKDQIKKVTVGELDATSSCTLTTDGSETRIDIPYTWLHANIPSKTTKYYVKVYYGTGTNDYVYKLLYSRSVKDAPVTGDQDMGIYEVLLGTSAIVGMSATGVYLNKRKRKEQNL